MRERERMAGEREDGCRKRERERLEGEREDGWRAIGASESARPVGNVGTDGIRAKRARTASGGRRMRGSGIRERERRIGRMLSVSEREGGRMGGGRQNGRRESERDRVSSREMAIGVR